LQSGLGDGKTGWLSFSAKRRNFTGLKYEILCPVQKTNGFGEILQTAINAWVFYEDKQYLYHDIKIFYRIGN
jgi:hypothetical protein